MGITHIVSEYKDYAGGLENFAGCTNHCTDADMNYAAGLENFAGCANHCADADMLLQRFFDILTKTQKKGKYLIIRFDEINPVSHLIVSRGFDDSQSRQITQHFDSWSKQLENLPQELDAFPEIFSRVLDLHAHSYITAARQGGQIVLFAGCYSHDMPFHKSDTNFFKALVNILELSLQSMNIKKSAYAEVQKIIDAKQQWESTVDLLDVLICLLDKNGRVFRVNKTLEKWHLGSVKCIKGVDVHDLLHPDCNETACKFKENWLNLWNSSAHDEVITREFYDNLNQDEIRMTLLKGKNTYNWSKNDDFSTLIVEDTNESKRAITLLEEYSEELHSQVQNQTIEIGKISANLQNKIHEHRQDRKILQLTEKRLLSLSAKLLTAQEKERKRIAAELHDGVGQSISAIKFNIENMLAINGTKGKEHHNRQHLEMIISRLRDTVEEVRRISMGLHPPMIDELGLLITIQWLCRTFQQDFPAIKLEQKLNINEGKISEIQKVSIFRIFQEALNNIAKYSQADRVTLEVTTEENAINLSIEDNGIGFQPDEEQLSNGFGLCSMKERAKLSGGILSIHSFPGNGTLIKAVWTLSCLDSVTNNYS